MTCHDAFRYGIQSKYSYARNQRSIERQNLQSNLQRSKGAHHNGEKEFLSDDELSNLWSKLRESSADSGLYIFQHFFDRHPKEAERFGFTYDQYGNVSPNFIKSEGMHARVVGTKPIGPIALYIQRYVPLLYFCKKICFRALPEVSKAVRFSIF